MAKPPRQTKPKGSASSDRTRSSNTITDPRFTNIQTDPRYRLPSRKQHRVPLDERFAHMLKDDEFSRKSRVDRYGRKIPKTQGRKELERLYRLEDDEEDEVDDDEEVRDELRKVERRYDPARDGGFSESSSEEESSSDEEEEDMDAAVEAGIEEDAVEDGGIPMGEVSSRVAAVNMDWDNIRAVDLMAVASSFSPPDGKILKVTVYPSEFGRERMEREEFEGPPAELFASRKLRTTEISRKNGTSKRTAPDSNASTSEVSDEEGNEEEEDDDEEEQIKNNIIKESTAENPEVDTHALRTYQMSRLRYYYAVLECDSTATAQALYNAMDGREYLATANFFDLRFIPDDVTFNDPVTDKPRDECTRVPQGYRPNEFVTEALTHSNVRLTWDEDDRSRKEVQKRAFSGADMEDEDMRAYVGSESSDDDEVAEDAQHHHSEALKPFSGFSTSTPNDPSELRDTKNKPPKSRDSLRAALGLTSKPSKTTKRSPSPLQAPMQITFTPGLNPSSNSAGATGTTSNSIFQNSPSDVHEETTREKYIRKEKERKARRKERARAAYEAEKATTTTTTTAPQQADDDVPTVNDPFADPFFADPGAANAQARATSKQMRRNAATKPTRDDDSSADAARRAELELLRDDGDAADAGFDMAAVKRAEKDARRKGRKKGRRGKDGEEVGQGFEVDVADPRFSAVYERPEYAIDPSHARFSGTEGMRRVLEEGRRRRGRGDEEVEAETGERGRKQGGNREVDELVTRVKRRKVA